MNRPLTLMIASLLGMALMSTRLLAQVTLGPDGPVNPQAEKRQEREQKFRLTVDPAAAPRPSLKHSLLPNFLNQTPGNGAPYYYRAILALRNAGPDARTSIEAWFQRPLEELDSDKVNLAVHQRVLEMLQTASHREYCDWQWRIRDLDSPSQFYQFLLPEVNDARDLGRLLALKARVAIAEQRYDDAIDTLTIGYKLAHDVAEPPTLINDLVGIAIAEIMNGVLIELLDAPNSPNLYWALAELPRPLIDMRRAMQHEMLMPLLMFPVLQDPETTRRSSEEWRDLVIQVVKEVMAVDGGVSDMGPISKDRMTEAAALGLVTLGYPRAKRELIEAGFPREQIEKMSVGQVVAIHQSRTYAFTYHELFKWTLLPFHEAWQHQERARQSLKDDRYLGRLGSSREIIPLASLFLPAIGAARRAEVRLSARLNALQAIEAIRMYAAEQDGRLPPSLSDMGTVPAPRNPMTGQPFPYRVDGKTALLEIPEAAGMGTEQAWRFEVKLSNP